MILPANPGVLFDFRRSVREWLLAANLEPSAQDALLLAVHEAVANGVEHANGSPVRVQGSVDNGGLIVEITTKGSWVVNEEADTWLAERGRGLSLMRGLTDELEILTDGGCVTIRLRQTQA